MESMQQQSSGTLSAEQIAAEHAAFFRKVYLLMATGLLATAIAAMVVASSPAALALILGHRIVFYGLLIVELVMVVSFAAVAKRVSAVGAGALFFAYAIVNGLTLSIIFLIYTQASIAQTFVVTAGTFGIMSFYGYVTKRDLTGVGHFMMMGLVGLILASLVNLFLRNPAIYWVTTFMGIIIFVGLTAYDTQKLKQLNVIGNAGTEADHKEAIHGALILYLDFINLFLFMLRLVGRRR